MHAAIGAGLVIMTLVSVGLYNRYSSEEEKPKKKRKKSAKREKKMKKLEAKLKALKTGRGSSSSSSRSESSSSYTSRSKSRHRHSKPYDDYDYLASKRSKKNSYEQELPTMEIPRLKTELIPKAKKTAEPRFSVSSVLEPTLKDISTNSFQKSMSPIKG